MSGIGLQIKGNARWQSPADMTRIFEAFIGRRLHAVWRVPDTESETGDVWLQFCPRGEEARLLRLTANRSYVTSWYGPSSWCLRVEVEQALPSEGLERWPPFLPHAPTSDESLRDWALTELWVSPVPCNILAPQGRWLQDVCGGLALYFSNTTEADYGCLLGATYEHHDEDAPNEYFCADILPPLTGSGLWRRMAYLRDDTPRDDKAVRHAGYGYRDPAVLGCLEQFNRELEQFQKWFEKEAAFHTLHCEAIRHWHKHHVDQLNDLEELQNWAESPRSQLTREILAQEVAKFGLGTLFSDAWYERDSSPADEPRARINSNLMKEIRRHYAPLREAYRQWFQLHRQASLADKRLHKPQPEETVPDWMLQLHAALTRGSLRFDELQQCLTAQILRDDFRDPWAPHEELKELRCRLPGAASDSPQDVLIEADEERASFLRITYWPALNRHQIVVLRVSSEALQEWWLRRKVQPMPSSLAQYRLSGRAVTETWPTLPSIVAHAEERQLVPPGVTIKADELPPYTRDDIRWVARLCMQGEAVERWPHVSATDPELVWTLDSSHRRIPLLLGRDIHPQMSIDQGSRAAERVIFPAAWPPEVLGNALKPFYLKWSGYQWREKRIEGRDYRRENWLLPVQRWVPLTEDVDGPYGWRWGLVDLDGHFVLPCRYPAMGFPQARRVGNPVQPERRTPLGRREPWCWVWVGDEEHANGLLATDREPAIGDVIEAWSGERMNSADLAVRRLDNQFMIVCARADLPKIDHGEPLAHGLCNLATGKCGPVRWQHITTFGLSVAHAARAQCVQTGQWTYVDENGEALTPGTYARTEQLDSGLAIVQLSITQAETQGIALSLPDGSRQGPVGVFGPHGVAPMGQWFVEPQWRDILGEYDGHFIVQDAQGRWGVITPEGEAITPFIARQNRERLSGDILHQVLRQFKRVQQRRFVGWMQEARASGSLAVMAGKLRSSFGAYDFGALPQRDFDVRLTRNLPSAPEPYHDISLVAGAEFSWRPGQRNYYSSIDLRTHTVIGFRAEHRGGHHGIAVPWDALTLATFTEDRYTDAERRHLPKLGTNEHLVALNGLLDALVALSSALETDPSIVASDAEIACSRLSGLCSELAVILALGEPMWQRHHVLSDLRDDLDCIDLPSILTRARYELVYTGRRFWCGRHIPLWIGDDSEKSAVATQTPWALAVREPLNQAIAAYQVWLPLFRTAIAQDEQGTQV